MAIVTVAPFFVVWDILFTIVGVWGFNPNYHLGMSLMRLPLEEILFFLFIPFCCLFTYHAVAGFIQNRVSSFSRYVFAGLGVLMVVAAITNWGLRYSCSVTGLSAVVFFIAAYKNPPFLKRFLCTYLVLTIPFLVVNGALTGSFSKAAVVWYNPDHITGIRVFTIPIEDFIYSGLLTFLNVVVFDVWSKFHKSREVAKTLPTPNGV